MNDGSQNKSVRLNTYRRLTLKQILGGVSWVGAADDTGNLLVTSATFKKKFRNSSLRALSFAAVTVPKNFGMCLNYFHLSLDLLSFLDLTTSLFSK